MMRTTRAVAVCSLLAAAAAAIPLDATVIVPAGLQTLAVEARTIVWGRVTDVRAQVRPGTRRIDSFVVFAVDEALKGEPGASVVFRTLGGELGRYRTIVHGAPVFRPGDEAVVFLGRGAVPYPIGLSHGVFRVNRDRVTGERRIIAPPMLLDPKGALTVRRGDGTRVPMTASNFAALVRRALRRQP